MIMSIITFPRWSRDFSRSDERGAESSLMGVASLKMMDSGGGCDRSHGYLGRATTGTVRSEQSWCDGGICK